MDKLTEQVVVITGASSGIGKAIALALAERGHKLCLVGRNLEALEIVAMTARSSASQVKCYQADLMFDEEIKDLSACIESDCGALDILVHSAGFISLSPLESGSLEDFDRHYRINVRAPYALTQATLPMLRLNKGQIIFVNSSAGIMNARANLGQYASTKHALRAIADSLREEVNPVGVRVISVYPGRTATPMQAAVHMAEGREYHPERLMRPEDVATMVVGALSLPRTAEVTDIMIRPFIKP